MKILYLTFDDLTLPFAWSVHVRAVINGLASRGHAVRLVCPRGAAPGIQASCDALAPGKFQHVAGSLSTFVQSGRSFGADLVYVRGIHGTVTPALAAGRLERPLVVEVNGLLEHEVKGWRRAVARRSHGFTLARAARVVTVSPLLRQALAERYGFPAERIDVVPNGADTDLFRPSDREAARRELGLPLDRPIVVCVASFRVHHAVDLLRQAMAGTGALLVLVGKEGAAEADLRPAGPVPHESVPRWLAAADVCAYVLRSPDPQFGFSPLKLFEYMAAGRAIVAASDQAEIRTLVNESGAGIGVELEPEKLREALRRLLGDAAGRAEMERRGRRAAEERHSWTRTVDGVEASLMKAMAP